MALAGKNRNKYPQKRKAAKVLKNMQNTRRNMEGKNQLVFFHRHSQSALWIQDQTPSRDSAFEVDKWACWRNTFKMSRTPLNSPQPENSCYWTRNCHFRLTHFRAFPFLPFFWNFQKSGHTFLENCLAIIPLIQQYSGNLLFLLRGKFFAFQV